jgi:hypothetical protein
MSNNKEELLLNALRKNLIFVTKPNWKLYAISAIHLDTHLNWDGVVFDMGMSDSECQQLHEEMYKKEMPVSLSELECYWFRESQKHPEKSGEENSIYMSQEEIIELEEYCKAHEEFWTVD